MFVKFGAGDEFAAMLREVFEDGVFARGESNGLAGLGDGLGAGIEADVVDFKFRMGVASAAADQCAQAGEQFGEVEGFDEIIVSSGVEAFDAIFGGVARGK